jgi:pimeloyl-ACP methyl ester carboxylesterase
MTKLPFPARVLRWTKRIVLSLVGLFVLAVVAGSIWEALAWRQTLKDYPPPGEMVDIGGRQMHIDCRGNGSPTVVFEAGLDVGGAISWTLVHDSIAEKTRACAYNRAGIVWSDPSPGPHNAVTVANDLHATLEAADEPGPYVLVGHSLGGPYSMTYTRLHGDDVAGLVFVDASHPDQIGRMAEAAGKELQPSLTPMKIAARLSFTGIVRLISGQIAFDQLPDQRPIEIMRAYLPRTLGQMLLEMDSLDATLAEAGTLRDLGDRPLVVLTAMAPHDETMLATTGMTREQAQAFQNEWKVLHEEEASWSTSSRHELVPDATHYIQMDRPDVVIRAVEEVVDAIRARSSESQESLTPPAATGVGS